MTSFNLVDQIDNDKVERLRYEYKIDLAIDSMCIRLGLSLQDILKLACKYGSTRQSTDSPN